MHHLVRRARHDVFLDQRLDAVRRELQKAKRPDAVRSQPVLDAPESLPLDDRREREDQREHRDERQNRQQNRHQRLDRLGAQPDHERLRIDKNLVQ